LAGKTHPLGRQKGALRVRWKDLDAIAATHQDAVLGPSQMRDVDGEPDSDREESQRECESRDVCQHALSEIVRLLPVALITGQIVGYFEFSSGLLRISALAPRHRYRVARPELEHAVLIF